MGRGYAQDRGEAQRADGRTAVTSVVRRRIVWLQLLIGWLPIWALFATLILTAHPGSTPLMAALIGLRMIIAAVVPGLLVQRLTTVLPWPHPFRLTFVIVHLLAAVAFGVVWVLANSLIESVLRAHVVLVLGGAGLGPFIVLGVWIYVMIAGVSYAMTATERAARAEASAARSQLAALRAQLNPHFLFNALHTVVQLIPREPRRAAQAAEQIAGLLRTTIEEDRDLVSVAEEWAVVERYLGVERIRFGDRLRVHADIAESARAALIPSFALQTLVENAVRHGAGPREEPTDVSVSARVDGDRLVVTVRDTGAGADHRRLNGDQGTGLKRLRERLATLYPTGAQLDVVPVPDGGVLATLRLPFEASD